MSADEIEQVLAAGKDLTPREAARRLDRDEGAAANEPSNPAGQAGRG